QHRAVLRAERFANHRVAVRDHTQTVYRSQQNVLDVSHLSSSGFLRRSPPRYAAAIRRTDSTLRESTASASPTRAACGRKNVFLRTTRGSAESTAAAPPAKRAPSAHSPHPAATETRPPANTRASLASARAARNAAREGNFARVLQKERFSPL